MSVARPKVAAWTPLPPGPFEGRTLPEVVFLAPDFLLAGLEAGAFKGTWEDEAKEVCRRAARIRPYAGSRRVVTVLYHLNAHAPTQFSGISVLSVGDARLEEYRKVAAAESPFLDLTLPRRLAPADPDASRGLVQRVLFTYFGRPNAKLTRRQAEDFFSDTRCVAVEE
jgi:hypothetical protein